MKSKISLGFIGGGNMAEALIKGLLSSKTITTEDCYVCDLIEERLDYLQKTYKIKDTPKYPAGYCLFQGYYFSG